MLGLLKRYRELLVVAALLALPFFTYFAQAKRGGELNRFDRLLLAATGPVEKLVGWAITGVLDGWSGYVALRHARRQAGDLHREVRDLRLENQRLEDVRRENERLRELLAFSQSAPNREYLGARVIAVRLDPKGMQLVTLNRGSDHGVAKLMPVVVAKGVVGRIHQVHGGSSDVLLITDRNSSIAARIDRSRARANVRGDGNPDRCRLDYALRSEDMIESDLLVTSGTDGIFPRGLPVGRVTRIRRTGQGLYQLADAVPAVDVTKLEEVLVITSMERPEDRPAASMMEQP
jgi:rod shape-determining protein MreC